MITHLAGSHAGPAESCQVACLGCGHPCSAHLLGTRCTACADCKSYVRQSSGNDAWPITVSCLMITSRPRLDYARRAIACFERQTYPFRELVIVSEDDVSELADYVPPNGSPPKPGAKPDIRRTFFQAPKGLTLGDLRNLSVGRAKGYFITTWDDDDIHADERLTRQMAKLKEHPEADACGLARITIAWKSRDRYAISKLRPAWENTILARRWQIPCYPALKRGSDTPVVEAMKVVSLDEPELYVYNIHDSNTWPAHHFEAMFKHASEVLGDEASSSVRESLGSVG